MRSITRHEDECGVTALRQRVARNLVTTSTLLRRGFFKEAENDAIVASFCRYEDNAIILQSNIVQDGFVAFAKIKICTLLKI